MKKEARSVIYDDDLHIEAYRFEGLAQPFPKHFHEYYVIGLVDKGARALLCNGQEYTIQANDVLLFNPGDSHACVQSDGGALDYRGFNITREVMLDLVEEIIGKRELPKFSPSVVRNEEIACCLRPLHELVMKGSREFGKEENLLFLVSMLIRKYGRPFEHDTPSFQEEIERACAFIEQRYAERITLKQICHYAGMSKSSLLRAFTRSKGVTPYRYLENIRIAKAKRLLEQGIAPVEVALLTGFSDQSHFTNYFNRFIGLAPGAYGEIFKTTEEAPHEK